MFTRPGRFTIFMALLALTWSAPAYSQSGAGRISGVVRDVSGAGVPGVTLTVTNQVTGAISTALSSADGAYAVSVPPGVYSAAALTSGGAVVSGIQAGNRLPSVPKVQVAASATYQWQMKNDALAYVSATYQHSGSRFTQIGDQASGFGTVNLLSFGAGTIGAPLRANTFTFNPELPAYNIVNARIGVIRDKWDLALYANNLSDERAFLALDQERGTRARVGYLTNPPRSFGITTRIKF